MSVPAASETASSEANTGDTAAQLPPFSLLIPVYAGDNAEFFEAALLSCTVGNGGVIAAQTVSPAEVVVVQDGPVSNELARVIAKFATPATDPAGVPAGVATLGSVPVKLVQLPTNQGLAAALNAGLAQASHDTVARIDADDISIPDRFERQLELIAQGFQLVGTGMAEFFDDPSVTGVLRVPPVGEERIRDHARTHSPFNHPSVMYSKAAVLAAGGYQPFGKMEDYWLWVRMLQRGVKAQNIAEPLVLYRVGGGAYKRRGGFSEFKTELKLQRKFLSVGFITVPEFVRNVVMKGAYRLLPAAVKRRLFARFVAGGLAGDKR